MTRAKTPTQSDVISILCAAIPDKVRRTNKMLAWAHDCHRAAVTLVRSGKMPVGARVARGWHPCVRGQHSWVTLGDCYDPDVTIIDPTLWSYLKADPAGKVPHPPSIAIGDAANYDGKPHGHGSIWDFGRPDPVLFGTGTLISRPKAPKGGWSEDAVDFMREVGPLNIFGWGFLASQCPVGGWPAAEIIGAMYCDKRLAAMVPIDKVGMLTDYNPGGLYLPGPEKRPHAR